MGRGEDLEKLPVYRKAKEIIKITDAIVKSFKKDKDILGMRGQMFANACTLSAKIAAAEAGDIYHYRMECATFIKVAARELMAETSLCKVEELTHTDYLDLLREEIENFRLLYLDWVRSFDKFNDMEDEWSVD